MLENTRDAFTAGVFVLNESYNFILLSLQVAWPQMDDTHFSIDRFKERSCYSAKHSNGVPQAQGVHD